jgi:hypothetical protein
MICFILYSVIIIIIIIFRKLYKNKDSIYWTIQTKIYVIHAVFSQLNVKQWIRFNNFSNYPNYTKAN